jgi:hypothetical protein
MRGLERAPGEKIRVQVNPSRIARTEFLSRGIETHAECLGRIKSEGGSVVAADVHHAVAGTERRERLQPRGFFPQVRDHRGVEGRAIAVVRAVKLRRREGVEQLHEAAICTAHERQRPLRQRHSGMSGKDAGERLLAEVQHGFAPGASAQAALLNRFWHRNGRERACHMELPTKSLCSSNNVSLP